MELDLQFFITNFFLGIGLAMDAFSVSLANGLNEPCIKAEKMLGVAGIFGIFQGLMPLIGWFCVHNLIQYFSIFIPMIPWIALILLCWIGGNMIHESLTGGDCPCGHAVGLKALLVQGIATSIDALSVGFTIAHYDFPHAALAVLLIGLITFLICFAGIGIGKRAGTKLSGKAGLLGGSILIMIGLEIFITSWF